MIKTKKIGLYHQCGFLRGLQKSNKVNTMSIQCQLLFCIMLYLRLIYKFDFSIFLIYNFGSSIKNKAI